MAGAAALRSLLLVALLAAIHGLETLTVRTVRKNGARAREKE